MILEKSLDTLVNYVLDSQNILIFTGAGISTESGISDYRSKGGLWQRFQPVTIQEFFSNNEKRKEYWCRKLELYETMKDAKPNAGHLALVQLEQWGKLRGIITQNIDGLHQKAGNHKDKILELHGTNQETICLSCGNIQPWTIAYTLLKQGELVPKCKLCRGLLKPNTISFGQSLNLKILDASIQWAQTCDLFLTLGSSLVVEPAASIPKIAQRHGARLIIMNLSETPLDKNADLKISAGIGETFQILLKKLNSKIIIK